MLQNHDHFFRGQENVSSEPVLQLENLSVEIKSQQILHNIHLSLIKGELAFLAGTSGAGKTSLLKTISGLYKEFTGEVRIGTRNQRPFIVSVPQHLDLILEWSLKDSLYVSYDSSLFSSKEEFWEEAKELLRILNLSAFFEKPIRDLSGGGRQKVALVRALLTRPDILLLDEPTANLDDSNAHKIFDLLSTLSRKRGMTVLWASHNKDLLKKFIGRIIHIDAGRVIYSGHACLE